MKQTKQILFITDFKNVFAVQIDAEVTVEECASATIFWTDLKQ